MALLRAELFKLRSTRTTLALALVLVLILIGATLGQTFGISSSDFADEDTQRGVFLTAGFAILFSALIGIMVVTSEFRHGTIRPTLVFSPRRERVLTAKVVAAAIAGLLLTVLAEALVLALALPSLHTRDIEIVLSNGEIAGIMGGTLVAGTLWGGIGAGLGAIVRNQVGAIVGLLAWMFIAESLLFGLAPAYGRWAPASVSNAVSGELDEHLLSPVTGGVLLAGYLVLFAVLGAVSLLRRDVP